MSIIYDALKKSQQARKDMQGKKPASKSAAIKRRPGKLRQNVVIGLLALTCLFTIFMAATMPDNPYNLLKLSKAKPANATLVQSVKKVAIIPDMELNGVFLSSKEKMAMIDNQPYHVGDKLHGLTIDSISLDHVTLKNATRTIKLRNAMSEAG